MSKPSSEKENQIALQLYLILLGQVAQKTTIASLQQICAAITTSVQSHYNAIHGPSANKSQTSENNITPHLIKK